MKIDTNEELDKLWQERNDLVYQCTQRYIAAIVKEKDEYLRKQIYEYARLKSVEYGEDVQVIFMDEDKVNRIIDLGIKEYLRIEEEKRWSGRG